MIGVPIGYAIGAPRSSQDVAILRMTVEAGTYILSGQDVDLLRDLVLTVGHGAFTLSVQDVNLTWTRNPVRHLSGFSGLVTRAANSQTNITSTLTRNSTIIN